MFSSTFMVSVGIPLKGTPTSSVMQPKMAPKSGSILDKNCVHHYRCNDCPEN